MRNISPSPGWAWIAGQVLPLEAATISLSDPGFLLGDGVFETLRARHGRIFDWPGHRERMGQGFAVLGIAHEALATAETALNALTVVAADAFDDMYLRVQVVREPGSDHPAAGRASALARPCPVYPENWYRHGVRLGVAALRCDPQAPLAGVKSLSYLPQVLARRDAQARGFDDALILNTKGRVCESAYGNVIARRGHTLYAPGREEGALAGVTRRALLRWAETVGYAVAPRLSWEMLREVEEVVLVSTLAGVVPVAAIEGMDSAYLSGADGALAAAMAAAYEALLNARL